MKDFLASALVGFLLCSAVLLGGCGSPPKPEWSTSILDGPDAAPPECKEDGDPDVAVPERMSNISEAAKWQAHTLDVVAELRARKAKCGAWSQRQRRTTNGR